MDQLFGFIALTSPLFLIVLWLPVCIALAVWGGRKLRKAGLPLKIVVGTLLFLVFLILPFADLIVDRLYLNHLCKTEAGYKTYQTVELPAEYWDGQENPKFMSEDGGLDTKMFGDRFKWILVNEPLASFYTKIERRRTQLFDTHSGQMVGEKISFQSSGGWIEDFSPAPGRGGHCDSGLALDKSGHNVFSSKAKSERKNFIFNIFIQTK